MKKILFVAPHSFPIKSSESICNAKLAYSLACAGYKVDVYSCTDHSTYPSDAYLSALLSSPNNLTISSIVPDYNIQRNFPLRKLLRAGLFNLKVLLKTGYFYNGISIPYLILKKILEDISKRGSFDYDVVITRGFHTDLVGITLARRFGVKWIANWNDPYPSVKFPTPYGKGYNTKLPYFENRLYNDIQRFASVHTFPNSRLRDYMLKCFGNVEKKYTVIIPHMALRALYNNNCMSDGILRIIHCGDLRAPRSPRNFLKALSKYLEVNPEYSKVIDCSFIGKVDDDIPHLIRELGLSSSVNLNKGLNYRDALAAISKSNVSLIIEAECEEGIYLPTKVVDSIQCGIPIFAVSPTPGVLNDMIRSKQIGYFAENTSVDSIYEQISIIVKDYKHGNLPKVSPNQCHEFFDSDIVEQYRQLIN